MKLIMLTACEKVLQDTQSGHSLISVFHGLKILLPAEPLLPPNAIIPKEWAVFSKWELDPEEQGRDYTSVVEIFWPDGTPFANSSISAAQPTEDGMTFIGKLLGFPIGQNGTLRVLQSLTSEGRLVFGPVELLIKVVVSYELPVTAEGIL